MVSQQTSWQWRWLYAASAVGWFRTDDYDSRLYLYERSVQNDFSFPMYYGHGVRCALLLRAAIGRRLTAAAKVGLTKYFDRTSVSSGLQLVEHSALSDLLVQLRYRF